MGKHTFKFRMAGKAPEATSENVTAWLEEMLEKDSRLAPDPGSGPELVGLTLDRELVLKLANKKHQRTHVVLRRLIATKCNLPPAKDEEESAAETARALLPEKVLPQKQQLTPEDMLLIVKTMDKGMVVAYRQIYGLKDLDAAQTEEEDANLAKAMAECGNRRSPAWLLQNADLVKLTMAAVRWGMAQTDELDKNVSARREEKKNGKQPILISPERPADSPGESDSSAPAPAMEVKHEEVLSSLENLDGVQREGEF